MLRVHASWDRPRRALQAWEEAPSLGVPSSFQLSQQGGMLSYAGWWLAPS